MTARGRRYEIRTPTKELVAMCRARRGSDALTFFADEKESQELFRFEPKSVRQYAAAYDLVDGPTGRTIGEFRMKVYRPLKKSEWFIFNPEGEPIGMVTEAAPPPTLLGRLLPMIRRRGKSFEVHWGQAVGGRISRGWALLGLDHTEVDLSLDKHDAVDRRLALGVAILVTDHEREPRPNSS